MNFSFLFLRVLKSRDSPSESRNTAESDDDLLPVIQSKAVLPLHLQNLSYPLNPYDHVYKKREQLELDFELKDFQSIKIPLPLPQVRNISIFFI